MNKTPDSTADQDAARTGQVRRSAAEVYEAFFVPALFGQWPSQILELTGFTEGDTLLDVGCGTGILAREAARSSTDAGAVTGVDLNEGMLAVAAQADPSVAWRQGPAEDLPFADHSFDRTVSQFALMFFADRSAAVREMVRVTRPGGTVTFATWAALDQSPGYQAMVDLLDRLFGQEAADALRAPFVIGTEAALLATVGDALPQATVTRLEGEAHFESIDAWVHTDVRGWTLADMIDDDQFEELRSAANQELAPFVTEDGSVRFAAPALVAGATVPVSS